MKNSVNADCNDQNRADQSGDHKGAPLSDKGRVENVFQYQASEIHNSDYKKNVNKSTEKVISNMLQNAVQAELDQAKAQLDASETKLSSAVASII